MLTSAEFLRHVWPEEGVYAIATPFTIPGTTTRTYAHKTFDTIDDAVRFVESQKARADIYFAVHTLQTHKVWNPEKTNRKTGELGAYEIRTIANMEQAKCLFFDLDVGVSNERVTKYATQVDALAGLMHFCRTAHLPRPTVVSSGGGLHVYWVLDRAIASTDWKRIAVKLRQLAKIHGLLADPARTTDVTSVLRVADTWNHKSLPLRAVSVLHVGTPSTLPQFVAAVQSAITRAGVQETVLDMPHSVPGLESNLDHDGLYDGPPVTLRALVTACQQVRRIVQLRGNVSEPEWYHTINLVRFVEQGDIRVHQISEGHPAYSREATDAKVAQLREKQIKPTSCAKLAEVAGDEGCATCVFAGKVKSPIVAARYKDPAPVVVLPPPMGTTVPPVVVPAPPSPYMRMKGGGIALRGKTKDGDESNTVIYEHDLYPVRRLVNAASAVEQQVWCVVLPREGAKEFTLDADALYDRRKFVSTIANHGIYPVSSFVPFLQDYMIAYITELQRLVDAETQSNHLGWSEQHTQFILPDKVLHADGNVKPSQLSIGAARASAQVHTQGELHQQVSLLNFYRNPAYLPNQFYIMASLAAPLFYMTGHHGVVVNASGEAGASKSTSLYTAASLWGQPELYPINGTNNGATVRGRNERVTTLANLPICVDEITHMPVKDAIDLVMSVTQPGHRIRLNTEGIERNGSGSYKATIMLATANNSLHGVLSTDNAAGTAGSMRVVEIIFKAHHVHKKHEADAFWHALKQHYGHVGEAFMQYVVTHLDEVSARVRAMMRTIDEAVQTQASERFWSATIATILVAGEIAHELRLLPYDMAAVREWALTVQVPYMRGVVRDEYTNPLGILAEYLEHINGDILVATRMAGHANLTNVIKAPRGQLLAHFDTEEKTMWVLKKGFKDYCVRSGANFLKILDDLSIPRLNAEGVTSRILASKNARKVLGSGTEYAKAQSWCFVINMAHPEITGAVDLALVKPDRRAHDDHRTLERRGTA